MITARQSCRSSRGPGHDESPGPGFVPEIIAEQAYGLQRFLMKYVMPLLPMAHAVEEATDTFLKVEADPEMKGKGGEFYGEMKVVDSSPESRDAEGICHRRARATQNRRCAS
jgi:hypothetical protein